MSKKLPKTLSRAEQLAALQSISARSQCHDRDKAILLCMLDGGMRVSEVCNLLKTNIDWQQRRVLIMGKGSKERYIYFTDRLATALQTWLSERPVESPFVFYALRFDYLGKQMTTRAIRYMIQHVAGVHPHALRHTFATDLLRKTKNVRLTQRALGHASIQTTMVYTHIVDEELEQAWQGLRDSA